MDLVCLYYMLETRVYWECRIWTCGTPSPLLGDVGVDAIDPPVCGTYHLLASFYPELGSS